MRWPPDSWPWPRSLLLVFCSSLLFVLGAVAGGLVAGALHYITAPATGPQNVPVALAVQVFAYLPAIVLLLLALPAASHRSLRDLGLRAPTARDVGTGLGGAVVMFAVVTGIGQLVALTGTKSPEQAVQIFQHLKGAPVRVLFVAVACVFAPIAEELYFRVVIFSAIRRYAAMPVAAGLSAAIFGLAHASPSAVADVVPQLLAVSLPLVGGGIVLAYVYVRSGCYWSNVITHATFNTASVLAILFFHVT